MSFLRYVVPRWTIAGVLALCIAPVVADITLPAVATPQVDSSNVRVVHGAQGQIILRAHYFGAGTLRFIIREKPAHGALSTPRPAGENQASVTYTNNGKLPLAPDRFTYVAETTGGQSSTIAEVQIDVVVAPPALQMPDSLAFEKIMAGQTEKRTLIIANTGGGLLTGSIIASHPWSVSRPSFRLGPGETESLTVLFQPDEAKNFVGQITVTAANLGEKIVQLAGEAETPVTFQPAQLRLALLQDGTNVRAGHATIKNELGESV